MLELEKGKLWALPSSDGGLDIGPQLEDGEGDIHLSPEQMQKLVEFWVSRPSDHPTIVRA